MTQLARIAFALLIAATFAAFFVAQRLKHAPALFPEFGRTPLFSPNHDGRKDVEHIAFEIKHRDLVTVTILDEEGDPVRELVSDRDLPAFTKLRLDWTGRTDAGRLAPDGIYRIRVTLRHEGRNVIYPQSFRLDTTPPHPIVTSVGPERSSRPAPEVLPRHDGRPAQIRFLAPGTGVRVLIFRTYPGPVTLVRTHRLPPGTRTFDWHGETNGRRVVSHGIFLAVVECRDKAGNIGSSAPLDARGLPILPYGQPLPGRGGITVRRLAVQPPDAPVAAGAVTTFGIDSRQASYRWDVRRVGSPRILASGAKTKPALHVHAPAATGAYLLEVRSRGRLQQVPFAVEAPAPPQRVLVVLPYMTWQGRNAVDDDGDGAPNLLDKGQPVPLDRILGGTGPNGLPQGFADREAPVLAFLDHRHHAYDITTDAALAGKGGPQLKGHTGVLLVGDERWLPRALQLRLRRYVMAGGRLATLGVDSLRRTVAISPHGRMIDPTPGAPTDLFGERLGPLTAAPVTLTQAQDGIGLFQGGTGLFGGYAGYEATLGVTPPAKLVTRAVTPAGRNVIVALRLGKGLVVHPGLSSLAGHLKTDPNAAALLARTWTLLSR
ncbi:MAG TPA: N,N-dimethylformamidase beta subunit family domain-containing protein [Solirubrobacteraceae bacterium]|nr:N,N-dimethylformamidase beta subunit family domain-containing protein [Solirubrobacteraceae bacterium]